MIAKQKGTVDIKGNDARIWKIVNDTIDAFMDAYNYDTEEECKEYLFNNDVPYDLETTLLYLIETKDFSVNSDRIRRVFLDYYKEKKNTNEIAKDMNISSSRVSELVRKCKFI